MVISPRLADGRATVITRLAVYFGCPSTLPLALPQLHIKRTSITKPPSPFIISASTTYTVSGCQWHSLLDADDWVSAHRWALLRLISSVHTSGPSLALALAGHHSTSALVNSPSSQRLKSFLPLFNHSPLPHTRDLPRSRLKRAAGP